MTTVAVVPAGGSGRRMGRRRPKQFLALGGAPLIVRTLRALGRAVDGVVVTAPAGQVEATRRLLARYRVSGVLAVVEGGDERQDSVRHGLTALPAESRWVVVHDAVRPFVDADLVSRVLAAARAHGAATCGVPIRETVKRVRDALVESTLDREGLWLTQTPQAFRRELLCEAHDKARRDGYTGTDDAVLVERLGERVAMVAGSPRNLKITTPDDLRAARRETGRRA
jgi:2-C-methyl-D-erythritol 4-phosphate cytidylyltransferase